MMRRAAAAAALLLAATAWPATHAAAQAQWLELRGTGFSLRGAIGLDTLTAVACDLHRATGALGLPPGGTAPTVVAVEHTRGLREWLPRPERGRTPNPLGAYWHGLYGHHIVVRVDTRPDERFRRVLHEYAHFLAHVAYPEPPRWLDEGIAELWEHAVVTPASIEIGTPVAAHVSRLRSGRGWIPVKDLVSADDIPAANAPAFYAASWALVHYLMSDQPGGSLVPDVTALPTDEELRAYVRGPLTKRLTMSSTVKGAVCSDPGQIRSLSRVEVLINRAQALADGEQPASALPLLREATAMEPANLEVLETMGVVQFRGNRPAEAAATFDALIAGGTASHLSYYFRAVLAASVPRQTGGAGTISEVDYLRKALALKPGFAPAAERLRQLKLPLAAWPGPVRQ